MSEDKSTHADFGMLDHHHVGKAKQTPIDPNHRADEAVKQTVHDILQGNVAPVDEAPLQPGQIEVAVPFDYVHAVAFFIMKELKRRGCTNGFSVKVSPDEPHVEITWIRTGGIVTGTGNGFAQRTNCLAAHMSKLDPQHVGIEAVNAFTANLEAAIQGGMN